MKQTMFTSLNKRNKYLQYKELNGMASVGVHGGGAYRHHAHHASRTRVRSPETPIDSNITLLINICQFKKKKQQSSKTCSSSAFFMSINAGEKKTLVQCGCQNVVFFCYFSTFFLFLLLFLNPHNMFFSSE